MVQQSRPAPVILVDGNPPLREAVRRIISAYHPLSVYQFHSAPYEDDREYDLLILVPDDVPNEMRLPTMAYKDLLGLSIPGDVYVWTKRNFERKLRVASSIPSLVHAQGKLLYEYHKV